MPLQDNGGDLLIAHAQRARIDEHDRVRAHLRLGHPALRSRSQTLTSPANCAPVFELPGLIIRAQRMLEQGHQWTLQNVHFYAWSAQNGHLSTRVLSIIPMER